MTRLGTCKHCYQSQHCWRIPLHRQPHEPEETYEAMPENYTCQWLATAGALPPPIKRYHGAFVLRDADCDACHRYEAVDIKIPGVR